MNKNIIIRAHHVVCHLGYKGRAYSKEQACSWDKLAHIVKDYPNVKVRLVVGKDSLCKKCFNNGQNSKKCYENKLEALDKDVIKILGVEQNSINNYSDIIAKLKAVMNPEKHEQLCGDCHWRISGLCKDTFSKSKK